MYTRNGLAFMPTKGIKITEVPEGTPFLYKDTVCLPHSSYRYTMCTDYFSGESMRIDDCSVSVTMLRVVDDPSTTPTEVPTAEPGAGAERLAALEDRVSELEALVKLLIKNS